ncbi:MAG: substrate-binding domain-containing protein [Acholeplasmataceae bacterium]|nr:substrate-binding domain-containing protein [Acholeplasmataceae bacterium]
MKKFGILMIMAMLVILSACGNKNDEFNLESSITVYTRDTTSGTRSGFMDGIGFPEGATDDSLLVEGYVTKDNTGLLSAMTVDEYGIGYISLSTLNDTVKGLYFEGVEPTEANVIDDSYGLKRPFMWMLREAGDYDNQTVEDLVEAFIAFLGTSDASDIINNAGAIALPTSITWDSIKNDYPVTQQDNASVTVRFGGSDSIQKVAEAITTAFTAKAGNFVAEHEHTGSGDAYKRTNDATIKDTSVGKDVGFSSRPFKANELIGIEETQIGQLAWDAIVAIIHKNNPVNNVTAEDLKNIYNGTYTTWADVPEGA